MGEAMWGLVGFVGQLVSAAMAELEPLNITRLEIAFGRSTEGDVFWRVTSQSIRHDPPTSVRLPDLPWGVIERYDP